MIFAGMGLAQLAAIFAAAAAVTVALYVLKLRRRMAAVPFVPLWSRILRDKDATSLFSKLKRIASLLLQLLLLLLLVLALGDPRTKATLLQGRTLVVLLDASASMQATDVAPTRFERAKEETKALIRQLGGSDKMLVAQMDAATSALGPMSADTSELLRAVEQAQATDTRADLVAALRFADDALLGQDGAEIVVVSDGSLGPLDAVAAPRAKLSYVKVGESNDNVAISQFSVRRYPLDKARYEVMLEITNTGGQDADVELSLLGDGELVDLTKLRVRAGERLPRFYPNLSGAQNRLDASLRMLGTTRDVLPVDDHAYAMLPERRRARVMVVTQGNTYLEAALLLDEYLDVETVSPAAYPGTAITGFDVVIFDGVTPAEPPKLHALYLDPASTEEAPAKGAVPVAGGAPVGVGANIDQPGFDKVERKHPLVRFLALDDVNIARGHRLVPQKQDRVIGWSQTDTTLAPLLVSGERDGRKFVVLGFDVRESDLPLRVAWPLFLVNTINWFVDEGGDYLSAYKTGAVWRIPVQAQAQQGGGVVLQPPRGEAVRVPVHEGRAVYFGAQQGYYTLGEGEHRQRFAANLLDTVESSIGPADTLALGGAEAGAVEGFSVGTRRELWILLVALAIGLTAIEWGTYHRRVTV